MSLSFWLCDMNICAIPAPPLTAIAANRRDHLSKIIFFEKVAYVSQVALDLIQAGNSQSILSTDGPSGEKRKKKGILTPPLAILRDFQCDIVHWSSHDSFCDFHYVPAKSFTFWRERVVICQ